MKIKDTERLIASHNKVVAALQAASGRSIIVGKTDAAIEVRTQIAAALENARQVRAEIGRPLP